MIGQIGLIQDQFAIGDSRKNMNLIEKWITTYKKRYPMLSLVVAPEMAVHGYSTDYNYREDAEKAEGPSFETMASLAKKYNLYIVYGFAEKTDSSSDSVFNSVNVVSPLGRRLTTYRKIQLNPLERHLFTPGTSLEVVKTEIGFIGLMICWDLAFPEIALGLAKKKASIFLAPSAWEVPFNRSFHQFAAARALDHTAFVAANNHIGQVESLHFFGESAIYQPDGNVLAQAPEHYPAFLQSELDFSFQQHCQQDFYTMNKERPQL